MSDQQKIWFIFVTDQHEGPFSTEEVGEKFRAGLVTGQTHACKAGASEWVALETIPELAAACIGGSGAEERPVLPVAPSIEPVPASALEGGENLSLARLLASSQKEEGGGPSDASSLGTVLGRVSPGTPGNLSPGGESLTTARNGNAPGLDDAVWTLKVGQKIGKVYSLNQLKELAASGGIPADSLIWRPGLADFEALDALTSGNTPRRSAEAGPMFSGTRTGITPPSDIGFISTAPGTESPTKLSKLQAKSGTAPIKAGVSAISSGKRAPKRSLLKRLLLGTLFVMVLGGGGGAAYWFLLLPQLPPEVRVNEADREAMLAAMRWQSSGGHRVYAAAAVAATPDQPLGRLYVATNLPDGAMVTLRLKGISGTLVGRSSFEKTYSAAVANSHIATFDQFNDEDGVALWGEFNYEVSAEDVATVTGHLFIGSEGGGYQAKLKEYKEGSQEEYAREVRDVSEYLGVVANVMTELNKQILAFRSGWGSPSSREIIIANWKKTSDVASKQLQDCTQKIKDRLGSRSQPKYFLPFFHDVLEVAEQVNHLIKVHGARLAGDFTSARSPDEIEEEVGSKLQEVKNSWASRIGAKAPSDDQPAGSPAPQPAAGTPPSSTEKREPEAAPTSLPPPGQ